MQCLPYQLSHLLKFDVFAGTRYYLLMSFEQIISALSALFYFVGTVPYIFSTIRGRTKPQRASWIIWLLIAVILVLNSFGEAIIYLYIAQLICCAIIVFVSLPASKGIGGWSKTDKISIIVCAIALIIKQFLSAHLVSVILACIVESIAFWLTVVKLSKHANTELLLQWIMSTLCGFLAVLASLKTGGTSLLYPFTIFIGNGLVAWEIHMSKKDSEKSA